MDKGILKVPVGFGLLALGIDPGLSGGLALVTCSVSTPQLLLACPMPGTEEDIIDLILECRHTTALAVIERVHSMPKQGVASSFKFGAIYGLLIGGLAASRIPYLQVPPSMWQKELQCLSGGDKNVTKRKAQQLFPGIKITHATADAVLLAEYARLQAIRRAGARTLALEDL